MKDNFSTQSDKYAKYRPKYPASLFEFLNAQVSHRENAWDCGTGNGQVAYELSKSFEIVYATDISQQQIDNAIQAENISYSVQPAEKTNFEDGVFDLVIVAQAVHWFEFEKFYSEVKRTAREEALLGLVGYGNLEISGSIDLVIAHFYDVIVGKYWDEERRYVDEKYETIPFPFDEIQTPVFAITELWSLEHLMGYLSTWSAVKHFARENGFSPIDELRADIEELWGGEQVREVRFPLFVRMGRVC